MYFEIVARLVLIGFIAVIGFITFICIKFEFSILFGLIIGTVLYMPIVLLARNKIAKRERSHRVIEEAQYKRDVEKEYEKIVESENK